MTRNEMENSLYTMIKGDFERFSESLKKSGNYDFFKSLNKFAQRIAFLKSKESHGINYYRRCAYALVFGNKPIVFSFDAYDRATKMGLIYSSKKPEAYITENEILRRVENDMKEKVLGMTVYKDFNKAMKTMINDIVADIITKIMFYRGY